MIETIVLDSRSCFFSLVKRRASLDDQYDDEQGSASGELTISRSLRLLRERDELHVQFIDWLSSFGRRLRNFD